MLALIIFLSFWVLATYGVVTLLLADLLLDGKVTAKRYRWVKAVAFSALWPIALLPLVIYDTVHERVLAWRFAHKCREDQSGG